MELSWAEHRSHGWKLSCFWQGAYGFIYYCSVIRIEPGYSSLLSEWREFGFLAFRILQKSPDWLHGSKYLFFHQRRNIIETGKPFHTFKIMEKPLQVEREAVFHSASSSHRCALFREDEKWRRYHHSLVDYLNQRLWDSLIADLQMEFDSYITFVAFLFPFRFKAPFLLLEIQSNFITSIQNWSIATGEQVNYNRRINAEVSKFTTSAVFPNPSGTVPRDSHWPIQSRCGSLNQGQTIGSDSRQLTLVSYLQLFLSYDVCHFR